MATINFNYTENGDNANVAWNTMDGGDVGEWFELANYNDNTITVSGTFDSNTLTLQGANLADKSDVFTLTTNTGTNVTFVTAGGKYIVEAPKYVRPSLDAGANSDIDVNIQLRRS